MNNPLLKHGIRLAVAVLLLFMVFRSISPASTMSALAGASLGSLLTALLLQMASNVVAAFRWSMIMKQIGLNLPYLFFLKSYFKGAFFNQGLPTSIGGDGLRILDCAQSGGSVEDAFFGVFIDRIIGLAGLLLLNIGALLMNHDLLPSGVEHSLLLILAALTVGLLLLPLLRRFSLFAAGARLGFLGRLSERYVQVYSSPSSTSVQLALSILIHLLAMSGFFMAGKAAGLNLPLQTYLVLVPPVVLLTILPISLAGWGVREGAMVGFFAMVGADKVKVMAFSLLCGMTMLAASLPGLLIYLAQKDDARPRLSGAQS